jgi:hypothetical protein
MPDRLEQRLAGLASEIDFPPTPDLVGPVSARIGVAPRRRRRLVPARRTLALAVVALAVLAAAAAALPPVREAVRDVFGIGGVTVERVPRLPAAPAGLELGRPASLSTARRVAGFELREPDDRMVRSPDAVYVRGRPPVVQVTLAYRPRPGLPRITAAAVGLILTQFRGDIDPDLAQKLLAPGTGTRRGRIGSASGLWIEGPHTFAYRDARGNVRAEERRLATNTLLWREGRVLLRLESRLGLRRALEIARSLR